MLLEQQNKKRLLMARQEQDNINHVPGSTPGAQGPYAQNMSPSGSRAGPSPGPNDQMRKITNTPKMGQNLPGSPAMPGDMQNRGTPPANGYHEMPGVLQQQRMFNNANNPAMMGQPPSSHPGFNMQQMAGQMNPQAMEQMRMANGGRMPNGQQWAANGQQQMMQQGQGPQAQGTPQTRNMTMPPPPAPNNQEQQRTQPSSPAQNPAPPTPSQTAKANPKGKKEGATKKVRFDISYVRQRTNQCLANSSLRKLRLRKVQPHQRQQRATIHPPRRHHQRRLRLCISNRSIKTANQMDSSHRLRLNPLNPRITWTHPLQILDRIQ